MANNRTTIMNNLVSKLGDIEEVNKATRHTYDLILAEASFPYIGVVAGNEIIEIEDVIANKIRFKLGITLFLITEERYENIEGLIDKIKNVIYKPINLGTDVLYTKVENTGATFIEDPDTGRRQSATQINLILLYCSERGAA